MTKLLTNNGPTLNRTFSYIMLYGASWATCIRFLPVECCPKSI